MTVFFKELGNYGRLGNMYFQMAATIGVAQAHNDDYRFPDQSFFTKINLSGKAICGPINNSVPTYHEPNFSYSKINKNQPLLNLHGYFQSEKYFEHCKDEVRRVLTPKTHYDHNGITAIHVRRTDYLDPRHKDCYHILTRENYYDKAMEIVPGPYLIFSDDIDWCRKNFTGHEFSFSETQDPITDLAKMLACDKFIIANSSFSWWGAWLSTTPGKQVVAPGKWFGPKLAPTHDTKDLIPDKWIKI